LQYIFGRSQSHPVDFLSPIGGIGGVDVIWGICATTKDSIALYHPILSYRRRMNMLDKKVAKLLEEQINKEFYSAYLYLDFSNYYVNAGLDGFANWYRIQAQEERDHAMLFLQYLQNNGECVKLEAIAKPDKALKDNMEPLKAALEHERYVTALIDTIYDAAYSIKDFRTMQFLDWFVKEQGEEEKNAEDMIKKMELFGTDAKGLYMLNSELGTRVYNAPSLVLD